MGSPEHVVEAIPSSRAQHTPQNEAILGGGELSYGFESLGFSGASLFGGESEKSVGFFAQSPRKRKKAEKDANDPYKILKSPQKPPKVLWLTKKRPFNRLESCFQGKKGVFWGKMTAQSGPFD